MKTLIKLREYEGLWLIPYSVRAYLLRTVKETHYEKMSLWERQLFYTADLSGIDIQYNLNGSNPDGSFTLDDSNCFLSLQNPSRKQIFRDFFLFYHEIVCCVSSLESPHRGDSNENTQHTIIV